MLAGIPNLNDLSRVYFELSKIGARCVGENAKWAYGKLDKYALIALALEMSRFDPRLFGILVEYFVSQWRELNPVKIREKYSNMETPQTACVVGEFLKTTEGSAEAACYAEHLSSGLKPVPTQFYFRSLYNVGGYMASRAAEEGLAEYKRWGFLATEGPVLAGDSKRAIGTLDGGSRINILKRLLKRKGSIQVSDYLKALGGKISRQQALLDLHRCGIAQKVGKGRGSIWRLEK